MVCGNECQFRTWINEPSKLLKELQPDALIIGQNFYSYFFASRFGPRVMPAAVEVIAPSSAQGLESRLTLAAPQHRWRVQYSQSPVESLARAPLIAACGGLTWDGSRIAAIFQHGLSQSHLEMGLLAPWGDSNEADTLAHQLTGLYPGLNAPFIGYRGPPTDNSAQRISRAVRRARAVDDQPYGPAIKLTANRWPTSGAGTYYIRLAR